LGGENVDKTDPALFWDVSGYTDFTRKYDSLIEKALFGYREEQITLVGVVV
jgi:hypothetical protein